MFHAGVAHPVERHLAKVEVASSSLVTRSKKYKERTAFLDLYTVPWPSGKARVCKTLIHPFKSGQHLQKISTLLAGWFFCIHLRQARKFVLTAEEKTDKINLEN